MKHTDTITKQKTKIKISESAQATTLGAVACKGKKPRVPMNDIGLTKLLAGKTVKENIPIVTAWLQGWDNQNVFPTGKEKVN